MIVNEFELERLEPYLKKFNLEQLKAPPAVYHLKWTDNQIFVANEGKRKRKIYFNTPYTEQQKSLIGEVKAKLSQEGLDGRFSDAVMLKHIYVGKFNTNKAVERLKKVYESLTNPQISKFTYETVEQLQMGFVYTFGRSLNHRPIVIIRPDRINFNNPNYFNAIYIIYYICQRYRMVPYHAQKLVLIVDLNDMKVSDIPITQIYRNMSQVGVIFCQNSDKIFVLNSSGLGSVWSIAQRFMQQQAKQRVKFPKAVSQMDEFISRDQRQQKYGGTHPNLTTYWPPTVPYHQIPSQQKITQPQQKQLSFYSVVNNQEYFGIDQAEENATKRCECKCSLF